MAQQGSTPEQKTDDDRDIFNRLLDALEAEWALAHKALCSDLMAGMCPRRELCRHYRPAELVRARGGSFAEMMAAKLGKNDGSTESDSA